MLCDELLDVGEDAVEVSLVAEVVISPVTDTASFELEGAVVLGESVVLVGSAQRTPNNKMNKTCISLRYIVYVISDSHRQQA